MSHLLDLPNELLDIVVEYVKPHDIENFTFSCKRLHKLARSRLIEHQVLKAGLRKIESGWDHFPGCYRFPELLELFLVEPRDADYVSKMIVHGWCPFWGEISRDGYDSYHCQYSESRMRAFEEAAENTKSIPCEETEDWISKINVGNENAVIALLLTRLHCLTSIRIDLDPSPDYFIFKTVKGIVEAPGSLSLSQLREVEINGGLGAQHEWRLATAFAALPSVVSLTARSLVEEPPGSAKPTFDLAPKSSSVQDLNIDLCRVSEDAVLNLITSTKSLHSFAYCRRSDSSQPSFAWICDALLRHAPTSLEKLSIRCKDISSTLDNVECGFPGFTDLSVLTIDHALCLGDRTRTADEMVDLFPASLEVLTLLGSYIYNDAWFKELVQCITRTKEKKLPCLKKLNFEESTLLDWRTLLQIRTLRLEALGAGFELTVKGWETWRRIVDADDEEE